LGYILGDFFTDTSGHPVWRKQKFSVEQKEGKIGFMDAAFVNDRQGDQIGQIFAIIIGDCFGSFL
jgi:hypothetical protein